MKPAHYGTLPDKLFTHSDRCILEITEDDTNICQWAWSDVDTMIQSTIYDTIAIWRVKVKTVK